MPLPNGTEVVARDGDRVIKQGAIGRVESSDGDRVTVAIIGGARATYDRADLTPRKAGQLRFARRRHAAWEALGDTAVLEAVVGSRRRPDAPGPGVELVMRSRPTPLRSRPG